MCTRTHTHLGQNRTTKRGKPAAFCAVWVIIAACAPLQKYHYMQMRKWKKLYANVSAGNCMQIRVCVLVVGKREYAKQTTELTTIIRGVTSLRSGLKSIRVKGPWTHGTLMKSQNRNEEKYQLQSSSQYFRRHGRSNIPKCFTKIDTLFARQWPVDHIVWPHWLCKFGANVCGCSDFNLWCLLLKWIIRNMNRGR